MCICISCGLCISCLGQKTQPPNEDAQRHVCILSVLMAVQMFLVLLNFIGFQDFGLEAFFGLILILLLFVAKYKLNYRVLVVIIFLSIYFGVRFMAYFLVPIQNQTNLSDQTKFYNYKYAIGIINFIYYLFCSIYLFYPYRVFKYHSYHSDPALHRYFESQNQLQTGQEMNKSETKSKKKHKNKKEVDYNVNYGDAVRDPGEANPNRRNNRREQKGQYQVFKGQGVKIG